MTTEPEFGWRPWNTLSACAIGAWDDTGRQTINEYTAALDEFRCAVAAWNSAGEPPSGPLLDRLNAARKRFIRAQRPGPL